MGVKSIFLSLFKFIKDKIIILLISKIIIKKNLNMWIYNAKQGFLHIPSPSPSPFTLQNKISDSKSDFRYYF